MNTPRTTRRHARSRSLLIGAALALGGLPAATPLAAQTKLLTFEDDAYVVGSTAVDKEDSDLGTGAAWQAKVTGTNARWTAISGGAGSAKALRLTDDNASAAYGYYLDFAGCGVDFAKTFTVSFKVRLSGTHATSGGTRQARIHFGRNDGPGVWDLTKNWLTLEADGGRFYIAQEGTSPSARPFANVAPIPTGTGYTAFSITVDPVKKRYVNVMVNGMDVTSRVLAVNNGALPWRTSASDTADPNQQFWVLSGTDDVVNVDVDDVRVSNQAEPWVSTAEMPAGLGKEWLPYLQSGADMAVLGGSALDFSGVLNTSDGHTRINDRGFAVVDQEGDLSFEDGTKARLFCMAEIMLEFPLAKNAPESALDVYVAQIVRAGYNAYRPHFLDVFLMEGSTEAGVFDPARFEQWQRLVAKLRAKGIYLIMDACTSWNAFHLGPHYTDDAYNTRLPVKLAYSAGMRELWKSSVAKIYTTPNPYLGATRLADDPQVIFTNTRNEAGLIFQLRNPKGSEPLAEDADLKETWQVWLERRYTALAVDPQTPIQKLNAVWGRSYASFDDVGIPGANSEFDQPPYLDLASFAAQVDRSVYDWTAQTLREMGVRSLIIDHNVGSDGADALIRDAMDLGDNHAYADHGLKSNQPGEVRVHENTSSTGDAMMFFRSMAQSRHAGRPFVITEWSQPFWNIFRHEAGLAFPAYAKFQGWSMIAQHAQPIGRFSPTTHTGPLLAPAKTFQMSADPVAKASEVMSLFLYGRGDVETSNNHYELRMDPDSKWVLGNKDGWAFAYKALPLLARFGIRLDWEPAMRDEFDDSVPASATVVNEPSWQALPAGKANFWNVVAVGTGAGVTCSGGEIALRTADGGYSSATLFTRPTAAAPMDFFTLHRQIFIKGIRFDPSDVAPVHRTFRVAIASGPKLAYHEDHAIVLEVRGDKRLFLGYKINAKEAAFTWSEQITELMTEPAEIDSILFTPLVCDLNALNPGAGFDPTYELVVQLKGTGSERLFRRYTGRWHKGNPVAAKRLTSANWTGAAANTLQLEAQKRDTVAGNGRHVQVSLEEVAINNVRVAPRVLDIEPKASWTWPGSVNYGTKLSDIVAEMRNHAPPVLGADNETHAAAISADNVYHSDTEQLRLEPKQRSFRVITPRSEGATVPAFLADGSLAPTEVTLDNVQIVNQPAPSVPASSSVLVTSLDATKTVRTSHSLLAVVSTDALNSGQSFKDYRRLTLVESITNGGWGATPVLLRRAKLELRIRNVHAATLKVYPLKPNGERRSGVVLPTTVETDGQGAQWLVIPIDTDAISGGPAVYFEIGA